MKNSLAAFASIGAASISLGYIMQARVNMEKLFAHAAALNIEASVVHELIAAEQRRAETSLDPFSWGKLREQLDRRAGVFGG